MLDKIITISILEVNLIILEEQKCIIVCGPPLQANSHNVELSTSDPDDLAMDCLELTLKSRVRHHEELEEYMAPLQSNAR